MKKRISSKIYSLLMVLILMIVDLYRYVPVYAEGDYTGDVCDITYKINSSWGNGYTAEIVIQNMSDQMVADWEVSFACYDEIVNLWGGIIGGKTLLEDSDEGSVSDISMDNTGKKYYRYIIKAEEYNKDIVPKGTITLGFVAEGDSRIIWDEHIITENQPVEGKSEGPHDLLITDIYPYMIYADSDEENAVNIEAGNLCINGDIATHGTISVSSRSNGNFFESVSGNLIYLNNKIADAFLDDQTITYDEDLGINEDNIRLNASITGEKSISITGQTCEIKAIIANGHVDISGDTINNDGSVIYSRYGNISLEGKSINLKGLLYAPFGELHVKADSFNANGVVIIADKINIECESFNCNYDTTVADFVGNESDDREMVPVDCFEFLGDSDADMLPDLVESDLGTDPYIKDSDGDGLSDYIEAIAIFTNPLETDTDDDDILDPDEDTDGDGLSNIDEVKYGTDLISVDTDGDNLTDYDEVALYLTAPLIIDTDGDGLSDYDDVKLGFSPLLKDTDANGVMDSDEIVEQTISNTFPLDDGRGILQVDVTMEISGNLEKSANILNVYEFDSLSRDVEGLFGVPIDVRCDKDFERASVCFTYDDKALGDIKEENLAVLWYDEANGWYEILDKDSIIDVNNNTVTYTTEHFSTYMLVDKAAWYDAWRENIDYGISSDEDNDIHSFDIVFVIDTSDSMKGSRLLTAKRAVNGLIDALENDDEAAIVSFASLANIGCGFTKNKSDLSRAVNRLSTNVSTNVNNGLLKALELYNNRINDRKRVVVLLCDGDVNYVQSTIDEYIKEKIQIHAINIENAVEHEKLQKMADQTNGQYYYGATVDELSGIMGMIESTISGIDNTDADGDGLYDIFETAGIKLPNGKSIYTDPTVKDTDGDGLSDYDEVGIVYNVDDRYIGYSELHNVKYFIMKSNPTVYDSDGDGINDKDDKHPNFAEEITKQLSNKYLNVRYLNIDGAPGGDQHWWNYGAFVPNDNTMEDYDAYYLSPEYRMNVFGCGVIAMTDLELFMTIQHNGYRAPYQGIKYDSTVGKDGNIKKSDYMKYAEYNRDNVYRLGKDAVHYYTGVLPIDMEIGIETYLNYNNHAYKNATWAPRFVGNMDTKISVENTIETMISRNLPVVFSYHSFVDDLILYDSLQEAIKHIDNDGLVHKCRSHYMTVIGYTKILRNDGHDYKYILEVTSCGSIHYIDYDEYANKLSYFSNILEIK